jgi:radical SAM superfamily enzyme YgiQ (UPF0313 family)
MVGGAHVTIMPQEMVDNPLIDHIFLGEAEETFVQALDALERGEAVPRLLPGSHPDLTGFLLRTRDLFLDEWRRQGYATDSPEAPFAEELPGPFVTVIAGRGCIYNCSYCQPAERVFRAQGASAQRVQHHGRAARCCAMPTSSTV